MKIGNERGLTKSHDGFMVQEVIQNKWTKLAFKANRGNLTAFRNNIEKGDSKTRDIMCSTKTGIKIFFLVRCLNKSLVGIHVKTEKNEEKL